MRTRCLIFGAVMLSLTACGYAEWPPRDDRRLAAPAPASAAVSRAAARSGGDLSFIGATAVRVGPGDTVYAIARRHKVSLRSVIEANGLQPPYILQVGQRLELPQGRRHRVAPGETIYSIAQQYGIDQYDMARLNGIRPPYTIRAGEYLVVPNDTPQVRAASGPPARKSPAVRAERLPAPKTATTPAARSAPARQAAQARTSTPALRSGRFLWPAEGRVISGFGVKANGFRNDGINIAAPEGAPVKAANHGVVAYVGNEIRGFGNLVLIKHESGWISAYAHTDKLRVKKGDRVRLGQTIADVGSTGSVTRPQLHFELRRNKRPVDPRKYLTRATG